MSSHFPSIYLFKTEIERRYGAKLTALRQESLFPFGNRRSGSGYSWTGVLCGPAAFCYLPLKLRTRAVWSERRPGKEAHAGLRLDRLPNRHRQHQNILDSKHYNGYSLTI